MTRAPLARGVAAATFVVAATCGPGPAPASAASCGSASGVSMVVDPGALGGAVTSSCDSGEGQSAADRYADLGVALTYVQRQPGFLCRVNGAPASDPCVNTPPADAYWGLFWTDGKSGTWVYSSIGITGLQVDDGGAVALAWQQGSARRTPDMAAPVTPTAPTASPTKNPAQPTPTASPTTTKPSITVSPSVSAAPAPTPAPSGLTASATTGPSAAPSTPPSTPAAKARIPRAPRARDAAETEPVPPASPTAELPTAAPVAEDASDEAAVRVPTGVTLAVLVSLLVAITAMAAAARRRRNHPS